MDKDKIFEALQPEQLKQWIKAAFSEAGVVSSEFLADDSKIENAAQFAFQKIPRFPYRTIISATIGEKGFSKLVFKIRDKMLESNSLDFSWINTNSLKEIISSK